MGKEMFKAEGVSDSEEKTMGHRYSETMQREGGGTRLLYYVTQARKSHA